MKIDMSYKWAVIVPVNAISGFILATLLNHSVAWVSGIILAIITYIVIYIAIDRHLQKKGKNENSLY